MTAGNRHGHVGTYLAGCPRCRRYFRDRKRRQRRTAARERVLVDGRWVTTHDVRHGVRTTYTDHMCRCVECAEASLAYDRLRKRRRREQLSGDASAAAPVGGDAS